MSVEKTMKWAVEELQAEPIKIRSFLEGLGAQEIKSALEFAEKNVGKDLPKRNYGLVHQDLINFLGRKLGFEVKFGDYERGPDGFWKYKDVTIVVESKTSPTWLKIEQASDYVKEQRATAGLVVCLDFTKDHVKAAGGYGNVRLLTTNGLYKLVELTEGGTLSLDDVISILVPQEAVKLDYLIDLIHGIVKVAKIPKPIPLPIAEEKPPKTIDEHFTGRENLRPIYNVLRGKIREIDANVTESSTRNYITFSRKHIFCSVNVKRNFIRVHLPLKGKVESERFGGWPADRKWGYVRVRSVDEIDDELMGWIRLAYDEYGKP